MASELQVLLKSVAIKLQNTTYLLPVQIPIGQE